MPPLAGSSRGESARAGGLRGAALVLALALVLPGCSSYDPHPASPSTPGDPSHPPNTSLRDTDPTPLPGSGYPDENTAPLRKKDLQGTYVEPSQ